MLYLLKLLSVECTKLLQISLVLRSQCLQHSVYSNKHNSNTFIGIYILVFNRL